MDTLIIVAHADDETLAMGGTIWTLAHQSKNVCVAALTSDRASRQKQKIVNAGVTQLIEQKIDTTLDLGHACAILGAASMQASLPDQRLDITGSLLVNRQVEDWIYKYKPKRIFTHHIADLNIDHRIVAQGVHVACRPHKWQGQLYFMDTPTNTEWADGLREPRFTPNTFCPLTTDAIDAKLRALECYPSEIHEVPHPISAQGLVARAAYWGMVSGHMRAEAFQLIRGNLNA
jgi:LmbE family N-acetylglucosaminyl deacetylase